MKKILFLVALVCGVNMVNAQTWGSQSFIFSVSGDDTATNTDQILLQPSGPLNGRYDVNVKLATVRVSGTLGATVYCQGSDDNSTWYTLRVTSVSPSITDTATIGNAATGSASFSYQPLSFKYLRLVYNTTGTQVAAPTATLYYRKHED